MKIPYETAKKIVERIDGLEYLGNRANREFVLRTACPDLREENERKRYRIAQKAYIQAVRTIQTTKREDEKRMINLIATERARKSIDDRIGAEHIQDFLDQTGTRLEDWGGRVEDLEPYLNPQ